MRVLAFDIYPNQEWAAQHGIEYMEARTLARESDLITLHTPLTPETDHIVNKDTLTLTKPGVMLINVSRGRLIHTRALIEALKSGHIDGVALDVYEEEEAIFFEDLSGEVLHDDELARLLTFPNACDRASGFFNARSPWRNCAASKTFDVLSASSPCSKEPFSSRHRGLP
jgi:D-lactate dehydrogenase